MKRARERVKDMCEEEEMCQEKKNEKEFILFTMVENALDTLAAGACPLRKSFLIFLIIFF